MKLDDLWSIDQLRDFLEGAQEVAFAVLTGKDERYRWMQQTLIKFGYRRLSKADQGIVIRYLMKMSGYARQQVTRLIGQYIHSGVERQSSLKEKIEAKKGIKAQIYHPFSSTQRQPWRARCCFLRFYIFFEEAKFQTHF